MLGITRASIDIAIGVCTHLIPHPIVCTLITGSPVTDAENLPVGRLADLTNNTCPFSPIGTIITASAITDSDSLGVARIGDMVQFTFGVAVFVTGSVVVDSI